MTGPYEETLQGKTLLRPPPGERHERICHRLHGLMGASVDGLLTSELMPLRARVVVSRQVILRPDLALVTAANGKLWLAAEIINGHDHHADTVVKKQIYEDIRIPRLWMIDPRYDNVEVYHASPYGLSLKSILAGKDVLSDPLIPEFQVSMAELFAESPSLGESFP
jgi:Uma2 family endonuclease